MVGIGCKASVQTNVEASGDVEVQDFDRPLSADEKDRMLRAAEETPPQAAGEPAPFGARHDVRLAVAAAGTPKCRCLAVALGTAHSPSLSWQSDVPAIDPRRQLVVALGSDGLGCDGEPTDSLGASYWGYKVSGSDVVVVVEAARAGRPITRGAIIPKPSPSGQVFIAPLSSATPYGAPLGASGERCALGNPG
jgi:hypothetical protein